MKKCHDLSNLLAKFKTALEFHVLALFLRCDVGCQLSITLFIPNIQRIFALDYGRCLDA